MSPGPASHSCPKDLNFEFNPQLPCPVCLTPDQLQSLVYLQHQDEMVHGFVALEQEVLQCSLVLLVKLQVLDHAGVFDQSQQDLL